MTAEVTPHHLLLTDTWVAGERTGPLADGAGRARSTLPPGERYDTNTKVNPPLRTAADCAALLDGLLDGTIDAIATDHAPHTQVDKDCEYGEAAFGISGLETALAALLALVHAGPAAARYAGRSTDRAPGTRLGAGGGNAAARCGGRYRDLRSRGGWTVDPERFASRGRNTPLAGLTAKGRVRMTLLGGEIVFDAGEP